MSDGLSLDEMLLAVKKVGEWNERFNIGESGEYYGKFILKTGSEGQATVRKKSEQDFWIQIKLLGEEIGYCEGDSAKPVYESIERDFKEKEEREEIKENEEEERKRITNLKIIRKHLFGQEGDSRSLTIDDALEAVKKMEIRHIREGVTDKYSAQSTKKSLWYRASMFTSRIPYLDSQEEFKYYASISLVHIPLLNSIFYSNPKGNGTSSVEHFSEGDAKRIFELIESIFTEHKAKEEEEKKREQIREIKRVVFEKRVDDPISFEDVLGTAGKVNNWIMGVIQEKYKGTYSPGTKMNDLTFIVEKDEGAKYSGNVTSGVLVVYSFSETEAEKVFGLAQNIYDEKDRRLHEQVLQKKPAAINEFRSAISEKAERLPIGRRLGR